MANPTVLWQADGTPFSPRFGDIYRSSSGLAQARRVFLQGCGLLAGPGSVAPGVALWTDARRWSVLETGFGLGLNFLATWQAWQNDPHRPHRLFYSAVEAFPPEADDLLRSAAPYPELRPLAQELAAQWHGLLPGVHRLRLDGGQVQLTLAVGDARPALAELSGEFDSIYLDGFDPERNPGMWGLPVLKAVARLARPGARVATWCVAAPVREALTTCGFEVERVRGPAPKGTVLRGVRAPRWSPRRRPSADAPVQVAAPRRCMVVGAGLAGASVAYSLAVRGWQVTVLDRADAPATGASGLPAGVVAPHVSPDDRPLSRLTRAGARATLVRAAALLDEGVDYGATGVLERHAPGERRLPAAWQDAPADGATAPESWPDTDARTRARAQAAQVPLDDTQHALWHRHAGWVRPAALVRAMLAAPGIAWRGGQAVSRLRPHGAQWQVLGAGDAVLAEADLVFVTAGFGSLALLPERGDAALPPHALRGQVAWGPMPDDATGLPPFPVNGHGSLIAHVPGDAGPTWVTGSTFERGESQPLLRPEDHAHNRQRLAELLPAASARLDGQWPGGQAQAWAGVRATLPDRLPAVGDWGTAHSINLDKNRPLALQPSAQTATNSVANEPPLPVHILTGLGARGLTLAVLCGEIAAAWLHGEPLPVEASLARKLRAGRFSSASSPQPSSPSSSHVKTP